MSMRGQNISREYQRMVWVKDENGKEFACYAEDIRDHNHLGEDERAKCLDTSTVLGDSW